jgi:hypothetical protein
VGSSGDTTTEGPDAGADIVLTVSVGADDDEELDRWARQLRAELLDLDVASVTMTGRGPVPPGAKGLDGAAVCSLLVSLGTAGGLLSVVVGTLRDWLSRHADARDVSVTVAGDTLVLDRASPEERAELVRAFIRRHEVES